MTGAAPATAAGLGKLQFGIFRWPEQLPHVHRTWDKHKDTQDLAGQSPMEGFHCLVTAFVAATLHTPPRGAALQEPLGSALS